MKILLLTLTLVSSSVFAQYFPNPVPFPIPCTRVQTELTLPAVEKVCSAKIEAFAAEKNVICDLKTVKLDVCFATCNESIDLFAKLRMDVTSDCRRGTAKLRKTVIKYY